MSPAYKAGDILQVAFPGRVDGQTKSRPVLFWMEDINNSSRILVSGIFGTSTQRKWDFRLFPNHVNGLTKVCFVYIDSTQYISVGGVLRVRGSLSATEFSIVKKLMLEYSDDYKANSPEDFGSSPFDVF